MLYRIESTFGGFGDVSVEIFALPKACHSGSVGVKYLITDMYVMLVGFLVLNTYHARVRYRFDKMTGLTKWYKLRRKGGGFTTQIQSLICGRHKA